MENVNTYIDVCRDCVKNISKQNIIDTINKKQYLYCFHTYTRKKNNNI
jgi:hypothetical protein